MAEEQNQTTAYRNIFKATSLFGGVQVYRILVEIIKSKFVAVLLGPVGMGIQGLYQSAIQLIQSLSSFGLSQSAVRDVSEANGSEDSQRIGLTVAVVKRLVWLTGSLGLGATIVLSPILSKVTFGNYDYTIPFIFLSSILLLDQLSAGRNVVLQGMRKLKFLAKSTVLGSTIGLVFSVPLYYLLGVQGIVPTLILNSITMLCLSWYFAKKVDVEEVEVSNSQTIDKGKSMLKMGLAMSISGIMVTLTSYLLRGFIRYEGGTEQVGLYAAGFMLLNAYVGMVFNAMATDYYPRLSAVNKDNDKCSEFINQQGEIATLIIAPILLSCIIFMPFIIKIIYSDEFLQANDYILWAVSGMMFKTLSWVVSFVFLAKAEARLFIVNEVITNVYSFGLSVLGYHLYGLSGLGIAFMLTYLIYSVQVYLIARKRYAFSFSSSFKKVYTAQILMIIAVFTMVIIWKSNWVYMPTGLVFICCSVYSLKELDKRMNVLKMIKERFGK